MDAKKILAEIKSVKKELAEIRMLSSDVMNAEAAAKFLGISKSTLDKITRPSNMLIATSTIGGNKKVFQKKDLIAFVEKHKSEPIAA